eukprot:TRINITY_DN1387_c0_g1_i2.p1 TRINITY_DN1387_c0_g1~~TRINITY_DN1387_c0_g1_i2.p1  ORF type:complete len:355 (-),score=26.95 TRINITY_DN1387_c0_g1_i2:879-1811(-)
MSSEPSFQFLKETIYEAPSWAKHLNNVPSGKMTLGQLPTPIHKWHPPGFPPNLEMYIKREDLSGMQLSGNKVRRLEFLIKAALDNGHDSIITIGAIQSNHCRATAVACAYAGLKCHLILWNSAALVEKDPGLVGNLLVGRMMGTTIHQVSKEEYVQVGSVQLCEQLQKQLQQQGLNPYVIPIGGSNALGTWGDIQTANEIIQQSEQHGIKFDDIVITCASGGATGGLALGNHFSGYGAQLVAYDIFSDGSVEEHWCFIGSHLCWKGAVSYDEGDQGRQMGRRQKGVVSTYWRINRNVWQRTVVHQVVVTC